MASFEGSIDVGVPLWAAYEEWTDFEAFPRFMAGVERVSDLGGGRLEWLGGDGGEEASWESVVEQVEGERVAWQSVSGSRNDGEVRFVPLNDTTTEVRLRVEVDDDAPGAGVAGGRGGLEERVQGDLEAFKRHAEQKHAGRGWHDPKDDSVVDR